MQRYFSFYRALIAISLSISFLSSCEEHDPVQDDDIVNVTSVSLDQKICRIEAGQLLVLTAKVSPFYADDVSVFWSSSDEGVLLLIEENGSSARFEGVSAGSAVVTVTTNDGGLTAECTVQVTDGEDPDPGPGPGPGPGPDPVNNVKYHNYYELPVINDNDGNGVDDGNSNIYYAQHFFSYGGRECRNYTVCFSGEHHSPLWVAAPRHSFYSEKNTSRSEAYKADPDIPSSLQYSSKSTGGGCNKGHVLGSAERLVCAQANQQVFYYSNIAPQLSSGFNTGGGGWNILEDYIDGKVCADTLYEVVGCYYEKYTDGYGYTVDPKVISFGGRSDVDMPTMFYYVVLRTKSGNTGKALSKCSAGELQCVAFVRSHTNSLKGQKVSSKELMSVADLEKITGFTYFTNVPNAPKTTFSASDWGL